MNTTHRPKIVTTIAWVWIVLGTLMFMSASLGLLVSLLMTMKNSAPVTESLPSIFFRVHRVGCIVQLGPSILAVIAGIHLLRLKSWARSVLEVMTWMFIGLIVIFEIAFICLLFVMGSRSSSAAVLICMGILGTVGLAAWGVPALVLLKHVRSTAVKAAIIGGRARTESTEGL